MARNVLLMLSSAAPPPPVQEVQWHTAHCGAHGTTDIITTHVLTGMTTGQSVVAFYGDAALANDYLGKGVFLDYIPLNTPQGQQLLQAHPLYAPNNYPDTAQGFVRLRDFQPAQPGEDVTSLNGIIGRVRAGLPLSGPFSRRNMRFSGRRWASKPRQDRVNASRVAANPMKTRPCVGKSDRTRPNNRGERTTAHPGQHP